MRGESSRKGPTLPGEPPQGRVSLLTGCRAARKSTFGGARPLDTGVRDQYFKVKTFVHFAWVRGKGGGTGKRCAGRGEVGSLQPGASLPSGGAGARAGYRRGPAVAGQQVGWRAVPRGAAGDKPAHDEGRFEAACVKELTHKKAGRRDGHRDE